MKIYSISGYEFDRTLKTQKTFNSSTTPLKFPFEIAVMCRHTNNLKLYYGYTYQFHLPRIKQNGNDNLGHSIRFYAFLIFTYLSLGSFEPILIVYY